MPNQHAPHDYLPLKPVYFLVLLTLGEGDRHGYAIVKAIEARTGGELRLEPGNLYRHLRKLIDLGMVEETDRRPAPESDDERRRYYTITAFGRAVAAAEAERMRDLLAEADRNPLFSAEPR